MSVSRTQEAALILQPAALLDRLDYEGRHIREDQIWEVRADSETLQWVWHSSFPEWLSGSTGLFWICGNPATGKSTLMHHIAKSDDLQTYLKQGNDTSWTILYHFFFDFGAEKDNRNNFEGFLRSLLCQLVEKICDKDVLGDLVKPDLLATNRQPWCIRSLRERLVIVLKRYSSPICMLLDGLDEYSGDKWDLVNFLKEIANAQVKLCVASRPSPEFNITFEKVQTIKMQDLNRPGIERMVTLTIQSSTAGSGFYDDEDIVRLADEISEKANGMFLWARFAINEIRDGWTEGVDLKSLRKKLDDVPAELEQIYARILNRVKPDQRQQAAHMLQLVCYAIESLRLQELYVATMLAAGEKSCSWQQITNPVIERFKKRILALTGGLLQTFQSHGSYRCLRKGDFTTVNVIHKTVRTFLDSQGWLQLLSAPHEGLLHAEVLWLRVCAALFPISFKKLPPVNEETRWALKQMRIRQDVPGASMYQPLLHAAARSGNVDMTDELSPLTEYAATFMLHHAEKVEKYLNLDLYPLLQPGISDSFRSYHRLCGRLRDSVCACFYGPEPLHFVHLAVAHRLERYVIDFLSILRIETLPDSPEWNRVFYLEVPYANQRHEDASDYSRMSLLEFALYYANFYPRFGISEPRLVSTLLSHYSGPSDAELTYALGKSNVDIVKFLLPYWPTGKLTFKLSTIENGSLFEKRGLRSRIAKSLTGESTVGPLWYIVGSRMEPSEKKELIDIFLRRGEDINDHCCPFGTALHAVILWLDSRDLSYTWPLVTTLIDKGADVNAHGSFGTPLELAWQLASVDPRWPRGKMRHVKPMALAMRELIQNGAINSKCDPDGHVPAKDSMLAFCDWICNQDDRDTASLD